MMTADVARGQVPTTLVMGMVGLSFYAVVGAVVQEVLERLDVKVQVVTGAHDEIFPLLGQGAVDLMVAAWLPEGHAAYWTRYGAEAEVVARVYEDARFFWAVPDYVPEGEVASIADLAKPAVAARMTKLIQGIGPAATISTMSQQALTDYGLDKVGYAFQTGTAADWITAHDAAVAEKRWFVFPSWTPQYLNRDGGLRPLADPKVVLGGLNHGALVAPRGRLETIAPRVRRALGQVSIGLDGVTEMDWLVNVDGRTPRQAARAWMSVNSRRVEAWLRA